jgi:predicted transcriptional regulator
MTVVSSKEFTSNQKKYFDLAVNENIIIRRGRNMFHLIYAPIGKQNIPEQQILEPDDDLRRAISIDELRERTYKVIDKFFANK